MRKFVYGPGIDEPICMIDTSGASEVIYYYHFDGLGSVAALSDVNNAIVELYSYDVFGEPTIRNTQEVILEKSLYDNPYMFTGRRCDDETGLYYYRVRYYKPEIGRFMSPDPVAMFLQMLSTDKQYKGKIPGKYISAETIQEFMKNNPIGRWLQTGRGGGRFLRDLQFGALVELNLYTYCGNNPIIFIDFYGLGFWGDLWAAKGVWGTGLTIIGGSLIILTTSPAWITAGVIIFAAGALAVLAEVYEQGKRLERPPGEGEFEKQKEEIEQGIEETGYGTGCGP